MSHFSKYGLPESDDEAEVETIQKQPPDGAKDKTAAKADPKEDVPKKPNLWSKRIETEVPKKPSKPTGLGGDGLDEVEMDDRDLAPELVEENKGMEDAGDDGEFMDASDRGVKVPADHNTGGIVPTSQRMALAMGVSASRMQV